MGIDIAAERAQGGNEERKVGGVKMGLLNMERDGGRGLEERGVAALQEHLCGTETGRGQGHINLGKGEILRREDDTSVEIIQAERLGLGVEWASACHKAVATADGQGEVIDFGIKRIGGEVIEPEGGIIEVEKPVGILQTGITNADVLDLKADGERSFATVVPVKSVDEEPVVHDGVEPK